MWEVNVTDEFEAWYRSLADDEMDAIEARIAMLEEHGPNLKRPVVGEVQGSRHDPQMKELRANAAGAHLRVLFMFDPRRQVILLVGGDKRGNWKGWYKQAIPQADYLYDRYVDDLREAGEV